jgi:hypothetical protein
VTDPPRHPRRAPQNGSQRAAPRPAPPIKALKAPIADSASPYGLGLIDEGRSVIHPNKGVNSQPAEKGHFSTGLDTPSQHRALRSLVLSISDSELIQTRRPPRAPAPSDWTGGRYSWMRTVLGSHGKLLYRRRIQMIEPVFAQTKLNRTITRFHRRGRTARNPRHWPRRLNAYKNPGIRRAVVSVEVV